jgi:hypothetical protein
MARKARVFELDLLSCPRCSGRCEVNAVTATVRIRRRLRRRRMRAQGHPGLPDLSRSFHKRATDCSRTAGPQPELAF